MLVKHFESREAFYRFLKERVGVFFKEAYERSPEGLFYVLHLKGQDLPPEVFFSLSRQACLHAFHGEGGFVLCGSESKIRDFCRLLVKENRPLAMKILEALMAYRRRSFKLQYGGKILPLGLKTAIMGVLNVTPDSFSDGGLYLEPSRAVKRAVEMVEQGADIVDIGGESTRPGSQRISAEEELRRVLPVLREVRKELPKVWISVDTYKAQVARVCLEEGADMVNDVSGGTFDPQMREVVSQYNCPYVLTHVKGRPETWRESPPTYEEMVEEINLWFEERLRALKTAGYTGQAILDPGIGFGKLPEHNVEILKRFEEFRVFGLPLLVGVSRKSFIGLVLEGLLKKKTEPQERLYGSLGALAPAVLKGAHIVRVHDVEQTRQFLALLDTVKTYGEY
ncbi:MAG: dihydropteroate synthase [Aquificaceae bacterium]|nr:dihydropteroate synthase [Aquificaceae bacterium]MCX8059644.1 dihydropteroate synthase [Aquificaceae bacterium]MDW8096658.1 dihydropteroate synthase [Aquificaceae bacterium]